jgi:hypothetical protein
MTNTWLYSISFSALEFTLLYPSLDVRPWNKRKGVFFLFNGLTRVVTLDGANIYNSGFFSLPATHKTCRNTSCAMWKWAWALICTPGAHHGAGARARGPCCRRRSIDSNKRPTSADVPLGVCSNSPAKNHGPFIEKLYGIRTSNKKKWHVHDGAQNKVWMKLSSLFIVINTRFNI